MAVIASCSALSWGCWIPIFVFAFPFYLFSFLNWEEIKKLDSRIKIIILLSALGSFYDLRTTWIAFSLLAIPIGKRLATCSKLRREAFGIFAVFFTIITCLYALNFLASTF